MKYEYTRRVPVDKAAVTTEVPSKKRTTSKPTKASDERKTDKSSSEEFREHHKARGSQGSYSSSHKSCDTDDELRTVKSSSKGDADAIVSRPATSHPSRRRTKRRRNTIPTAEITAVKPKTESLPPTASIAQLRRTNTSLSCSRPQSLSRSATPEVGTSEAASATSPVRKRSSSVFPSFFSPRPPPPREPKVSCLTCGDDVVRTRTARLPCTHRMCHSCLKRIFKLSINDPAHMPPKCCTDHHIDVKHVDKLFDDDFKKVYNRKFKEYNAKNRIYCPKKGCGQWIQPKHMTIDRGRKIGRCPDCKTSVCATCNQKMHKSRDCPKDPALKQFAEMAKDSGWQKCYNCSATVELKEGCNHMTCRCTAEFCMVCGLKWKSCDCPWFNYEQIDAADDPLAYQQEIDRRRDQEQRDAELARRLDEIHMNGDAHHIFNFGNATGDYLNQNFFQQARGFVNGLVGREHTAPDLEPLPVNLPGPLMTGAAPRRRQVTTDPAETPITSIEMRTPVVRRQTPRRRRTARTTNATDATAISQEEPQVDTGHDQERLVRQWASEGHDQ